jgi:hypothetical protein
MKVLVVAPGHVFSTIDVYTGLCAGLRANGDGFQRLASK